MNHKEKGTTPLLDLIHLNVFDCYHPGVPGASFEARYELVKKMIDPGPVYEGGMIRLVACTPCEDEAMMKQCHEQYMSSGHEGTIIRNLQGAYKLNGRSNDLQKYKDFDEEEFEIVGHEECEGRDEGTVKWVCKLPADSEEETVDVRPRGTWQQRKDWYDNAESYYGKMLTVRFQGYTNGGSLRFPVGKAIRDYE